MILRATCAALVVCAAAAAGFPATAGSILHPAVVSENPADYTPWLAPSDAGLRPHVDAIEQVGDTVFAGGLFDSLTRAGGQPSYARRNFVAFNASTGVLRSTVNPAYTDPLFDDQIWALESFGDTVFVGGEFTTVNGITRKRLVKIDAITGRVDTGFNARFPGGIVWDLQMWNGPTGQTPMLVVGGSMGTKLVALNPITGANTGYFNDLAITDPIPNARGGVAVNNFAINTTVTSSGTKLVATGNFMTVNGHTRKRLFVADLTGPKASLDLWYYTGFAKDCVSVHRRRIAYLQGVDFSPGGTYFVVVATGINPLTEGDTWPNGTTPPHAVCDAAARFELTLAGMAAPVWVNYTGADSIWSTAVTGRAVYVQGHFSHLDNPTRNGLIDPDAVERKGIGAIDPVTGKALPWDPPKPAKMGGKAFLVTEAGLWVGSDSEQFNRERHPGIAFVPLP